MAAHDWDEDYLHGFMPWDTDVPDPRLVDFVRDRHAAPGRALDVGCGTGTHALWLAGQGFDVLAVDISPQAIARARERARSADVRGAGTVRFAVHDFLAAPPEPGPFDLVVDRGVFHVFDAAAERERFAAHVAQCLASSGQWLSLIGSTEGPPREEGPPRRSARDIVAAIEPALEIVELRSSCFDLDRPLQPKAWVSVARRREVAAQLSTGATPETAGA